MNPRSSSFRGVQHRAGEGQPGEWARNSGLLPQRGHEGFRVTPALLQTSRRSGFEPIAITARAAAPAVSPEALDLAWRRRGVGAPPT